MLDSEAFPALQLHHWMHSSVVVPFFPTAVRLGCLPREIHRSFGISFRIAKLFKQAVEEKDNVSLSSLWILGLVSE